MPISKKAAILQHKCPSCREGAMFKSRLWSFRKPFEMRDNCLVCGQEFVLEPGFYWGAMYVAYGLSAFVMLAGMAIGLFVFKAGIIETFIPTFIVLSFLYVPIFRMARSIWIHMFVRFHARDRS
jgi:uncharacterized protein (DUF983 family)